MAPQKQQHTLQPFCTNRTLRKKWVVSLTVREAQNNLTPRNKQALTGSQGDAKMIQMLAYL